MVHQIGDVSHVSRQIILYTYSVSEKKTKRSDKDAPPFFCNPSRNTQPQGARETLFFRLTQQLLCFLLFDSQSMEKKNHMQHSTIIVLVCPSLAAAVRGKSDKIRHLQLHATRPRIPIWSQRCHRQEDNNSPRHLVAWQKKREKKNTSPFPRSGSRPGTAGAGAKTTTERSKF